MSERGKRTRNNHPLQSSILQGTVGAKIEVVSEKNMTNLWTNVPSEIFYTKARGLARRTCSYHRCWVNIQGRNVNATPTAYTEKHQGAGADVWRTGKTCKNQAESCKMKNEVMGSPA